MADGTGLGTRIRARRKALGLTLTEVAERAGLSNQYVSNLENGHRSPSLAALRSIATALGQTVTDLLGHDADAAHVDLLATALADAPQSLLTFTRSEHFRNAVQRLADECGSRPRRPPHPSHDRDGHRTQTPPQRRTHRPRLAAPPRRLHPHTARRITTNPLGDDRKGSTESGQDLNMTAGTGRSGDQERD